MKDAVMPSSQRHDVSPLTGEQIHGALLGAAVGDAFGWPYEQNSGRLRGQEATLSTDHFLTWRRRPSRYLPYESEIGSGEYSDDTQLLLATARAVLLYTQWARYLCQHELPLWLLYERGGGGATKRAADSWLLGPSPWTNKRIRESYFNAGGNGAAMRVLPHLFVPHQTDPHLMRDVLRNGILTHGHPRALLGARVYALAASWIAHAPQPIAYGAIIDALLDQEAIWGQNPERTGGAEASSQGWIEAADQHFAGGYLEIWQTTIKEIRQGLEQCKQALASGALADDYAILRDLGCFDRKVNGSGVIAALAVVYLFAAHATNPIVGLRTIAYARNADTDTLASMLGGLFGLSHGVEWIPEALRSVQDYQYLEHIAKLFTQPYQLDERVPPRWSDNDTRRVVRSLERDVQSVTLGVLGKSTILERRSLDTPNSPVDAREWKLRLASGQIVFVTRARKIVPQRLREQSELRALPVADTVVVEQPVYEAAQLALEEVPIQDQWQKPLTIESVSLLLAELASALPKETPLEPILRLTSQLLQTQPGSVKELRELIDQAGSSLDTTVKECYGKVATHHLFPPL